MPSFDSTIRLPLLPLLSLLPTPIKYILIKLAQDAVVGMRFQRLHILSLANPLHSHLVFSITPYSPCARCSRVFSAYMRSKSSQILETNFSSDEIRTLDLWFDVPKS